MLKMRYISSSNILLAASAAPTPSPDDADKGWGGIEPRNGQERSKFFHTYIHHPYLAEKSAASADSFCSKKMAWFNSREKKGPDPWDSIGQKRGSLLSTLPIKKRGAYKWGATAREWKKHQLFPSEICPKRKVLQGKRKETRVWKCPFRISNFQLVQQQLFRLNLDAAVKLSKVPRELLKHSL